MRRVRDEPSPGRWDLFFVPAVLVACALCAGVVFWLGACELGASRSVVGFRPRMLDDAVLSDAEIARLDADTASATPGLSIMGRCREHADAFDRYADRIVSSASGPAIEVQIAVGADLRRCELFVPSRSSTAGLAVLVAVLTAGVVPLLGLAGLVVLRELPILPAVRRRARVEATLIMLVVVALAVELGGQYRFDRQNLALYVVYFVGVLPLVWILRVAAASDVAVPTAYAARLSGGVRLSSALLSIAFSLTVALIAAMNGRFVSEHGSLDLAIGNASFGGFGGADLPLVNAIESAVFVVVLALLLASAMFGPYRRELAERDRAADSASPPPWLPPAPPGQRGHPIETVLALLGPLLVGALAQLFGLG